MRLSLGSGVVKKIGRPEVGVRWSIYMNIGVIKNDEGHLGGPVS